MSETKLTTVIKAQKRIKIRPKSDNENHPKSNPPKKCYPGYVAIKAH